MDLFGLIGYSIASIAYLLFSLLLLATKQKAFTSNLMLVAIVTVLIANLASALQLYHGLSLTIIFAIETIKLAAFTLLLFSIRVNPKTLSEFLARRAVAQFLLLWLAGILVATISIFYLLNYSLVFIVLLTMNLYPLVLLEQLYRNAEAKVRWSLWPLVIALGSLVVFDFVLYAQGSLINQIDFNLWFSRGYIAALLMPFFLLSSKRIKNLSADIFVSREVVFYSSMLAIAGGYLLLLAFAGYVLRYIEGEWSNVLSVLFLAVGFLALTVLFITNSFRRKVKVFINKHFFANKYEYRDEWLKVTSALEDHQDGDIFDNLCQIMASSLEVSDCAFVKINSTDKFELFNQRGLILSEPHLAALTQICEYCAEQHWMIDVREYQHAKQHYPLLHFNPDSLLNANLEVIVPVYQQQKLFGLFILPAPNDKAFLNWEDRDFLFAVSKQLANYLFLQQAQMQLAESQQFAMFNRMSAFVLHDLKNIQAQLALINTNAEHHRDNPEFVADVFDTVNTAHDRLDKVILQLRNKSEENKQQGNVKVGINNLLNEIVEIRNQQLPKVAMSCDPELNIVTNKSQLRSVLTHLLQNAQDACSDLGIVNIIGKIQQDRLFIIIEDNGCGMSDSFVKNELFKPFVTTKGNAGMGIGAFEAKQFIQEQKGFLDVSSVLGEGSRFTIELPVNII
ncbi:hypothetical protein ND16A_1150 [Thalassotalea sp. ND16A]|nr:hypothetical protein ND16A_1150 [Thalassotalea sp. ND16A]